jgi:tRNA(adenine34) deaminase
MSHREDDERLMRQALALAEAAAGRGETAVGAIVVMAGDIVGEGQERTRERLDPSAHAEIEAIRDACRRLQRLDLTGCVLYSTVEPCVLCGYAARQVGVGTVVYGVPAGWAGAATSRYAILVDGDFPRRPSVPAIRAGVLAGECLEVLRRSVRRPASG